jgi:hypothetical protein
VVILIYTNDLPAGMNLQSKQKLFADDISITVSHPEIDYFQNCMNDVFATLNKLIKALNLH